MQLEAPEKLEKVPAAQLEQIDDDDDTANVPTRQDEHIVAEAAEYFPVTQFPVTTESPVVAQNEPAGQAVHALNPIDEAKVPVISKEVKHLLINIDLEKTRFQI